MSEYCQEAHNCSPDCPQSALSIHTKKITDSCRDKDCIEDLRVYLTRESQHILDTATTAKVRCGDLLYTAIDVTPIAFNRKQYCIDLTFYYRIIADATVGTCRPAALCGLAVFSKRAVLCGEFTDAHIFSSDTHCKVCSSSLPTAVVEVLDPIILSSKVTGVCTEEQCILQIPEEIQEVFDDELLLNGEKKNLYVTLGQFSIIRLERDTQIVVPVLDYAIPTKECCDSPGCTEDPCQIFDHIPFPASQFTPDGCSENTHQFCDGCSSCQNT